MNVKRPFPILLLALILAGCSSPAPVARNFPAEIQYKVRSTHHWDIIALDVASQTLNTLHDRQLLGRDVYVQRLEKDVPFLHGFRNFLITHLVNGGASVVDSPAGALEINYDTQLVWHASPRETYAPGALTVLTGGILVLRSNPNPVTLLGGAVAADLARDVLTAPTHTELAVNTYIKDNGRFIMRKSDTYYVEDNDKHLFMPPMQTRNLEVTN